MTTAATEPIEGEIVEPEANGKKHRRTKAKDETAIATRTPGIEDLMAQAVTTGNMDTIERVFALRQELKKEAAKEAFFEALSAFQYECPIIKKSKVVPFKGGQGVMYRYAPLDKIVKVVAPLLTRHGLSYNIKTMIELMDSAPFMVATLNIYHSLGHTETSEFRVPLNAAAIDATHMNDAQRYGSAGTYAKRNAFVNGFGILTGDEDDDGASSGAFTPQEARAERAPVSQPQQKPSAQKRAAATKAGNGERGSLQPAPEGESVEASTIKLLTSKMEHAALSNGDFKKRFGLDGIEQVNRKDLNTILAWIIDPQNA